MPRPRPPVGDPGLRLGFRSGLEAKNAAHMAAHGVPVAYETLHIKYVIPQSLHTYTPDFPLPNGIIVETKGRFENTDRAKHLLIKLQWPDLDIRFVFSNPHSYLYKGSKTTLAAWADKHGYKWAGRLCPVEWFKEPGPKRKPDAVLSSPHNDFADCLVQQPRPRAHKGPPRLD